MLLLNQEITSRLHAFTLCADARANIYSYSQYLFRYASANNIPQMKGKSRSRERRPSAGGPSETDGVGGRQRLGKTARTTLLNPRDNHDKLQASCQSCQKTVIRFFISFYLPTSVPSFLSFFSPFHHLCLLCLLLFTVDPPTASYCRHRN